MSDQIEQQIIKTGATKGVRVPFDVIRQLVDDLEYQVVLLDNMTTLVIATYKGFNIAIGEAACVDPANYRQEIGESVATQRATAKATEQLWMLEGWRKHMEMINS